MPVLWKTLSDLASLSAFCGAGGSSLGYEQAGGKVLLAVDSGPAPWRPIA